MNVMILDAGNSIIKSKTATRETAFPHAMKALTETEYEHILLRAGRFGRHEVATCGAVRC